MSNIRAASMDRIRSLDGLRAISILMVLLAHARSTMPAQLGDSKAMLFLADSYLGVKIFFVISGYLITRLLIRERAQTGSIDIKHFYIRRAFRIFPIFYLYIISVLVIKLFFVSAIFVDYTKLGLASVYLWNYQHLFTSVPDPNGGWFFGHFWSLSMEEQFYLLWPIMFLKIPKEKLVKVVAGIIVLMPAIRVATYFLMPGSRGQIAMMLQTGGDSILIGCLGALLESNISLREKYEPYLRNNYILAGVLAFVLVINKLLLFRFPGAYDMIIGKSLLNIGIMYLIFWSVYVPSKFAGILNMKGVVFIGVLSYSLYIWQQLFLHSNFNSWVNQFPQNLGIVFLVGYISYQFIEKPILGLKSRFGKGKIKPLREEEIKIAV
ncbi:acyltransferase family protein [Chitinophaga tropicalis]|uniref:Acyltransferase family protein n=1 Tax=Chitinophaga tropicalis TaxID=2683588 RepID=A0A7K1TYG2_9BACT|nr:acyltransferase [Chitinophaga tropicalis]MVT07154.1 acyltransferase family protein [Chitinophaga tropicalis]